ncbi:MAG: SDR family NAD(P)-dependent oxidoreductase [Gammaproteobacteria bacterium]|jgi:NAD(P)-dependent dehydrogenase (short-subunit alcohol dehydrogenase family)
MTKSILITGCSSGIGRDAAVTLHARGWRVFATCRQESDCAALRALGLESFRLDYADEASLKSAAEEVGRRNGGKLDALFNNGAFAIPGAVEDVPRAALREIFEVNVFGQIDLINRCMPLLVAAEDARVINCSSVLGITAIGFRGAYNATKFALEAFTDTMRRENRHGPIRYILIEPGPIATRIRENAIPHFEKWVDWQSSRHRRFYEQTFRPRLYRRDRRKDRFERPPSAVTRKLIHALESSRPRARYFVTAPTYFASAVTRLLPTRWQDRLLS